MEIDRNKAFKLVLVVLGTLAALAVMSTLVQLIQTVLPFLIIGAGIFVAYRWALSDAEAPSADEVEHQARGLFSRFRRGKEVVETTVAVGAAMKQMDDKAAKFSEILETLQDEDAADASEKIIELKQSPSEPKQKASARSSRAARRAKKAAQAKTAPAKPTGAIEFKDHDVVISKDDLVQPDISRLEEKEKEEPQINDDVIAQVEARRRRLHGGK